MKKKLVLLISLIFIFSLFVSPVYAETFTEITPVMSDYDSPSPYVVTDSGFAYAGGEGWHVFDGSVATSWAFDSPAWVKVDLGLSKMLRKIYLFPPGNNSNTPSSLVIYGSNDDSNYIEIYRNDSITEWSIYNIYTLTNTTSFRYYRFDFDGYNGSGWYPSIALIKLFTSDFVPVVPAAPSDFAGSVDSYNQATWTWTDVADNETGFKIYDGADNLIQTINQSNINQWIESSLDPNTSYTRYIKAFNDNGESGASNTSTVTTEVYNPPVDLTPPSIPTGLSVVAGTVYADLTYNPINDDDFEHYKLYLNSTFIENIPSNQYEYQLTGLDENTTYTVGLSSVDTNGNESEKALVEFVTLSSGITPSTDVSLILATDEVSKNVFILMVCLSALFPCFIGFKKILRFAERAFDNSFIRKVEGSGIASIINLDKKSSLTKNSNFGQKD